MAAAHAPRMTQNTQNSQNTPRRTVLGVLGVLGFCGYTTRRRYGLGAPCRGASGENYPSALALSTEGGRRDEQLATYERRCATCGERCATCAERPATCELRLARYAE